MRLELLAGRQSQALLAAERQIIKLNTRGAPPGQGPAATPAPGVHLLVCCEGFQLGMFCVFVLWEVPGMWSPRHVRTQGYWRVASGNNQIIRLWVRVAILCF